MLGEKLISGDQIYFEVDMPESQTNSITTYCICELQIRVINYESTRV